MLINHHFSAKQLRKNLRQCRRALNHYQQRKAAKQLAHRLSKTPAFQHAEKIGFYQAMLKAAVIPSICLLYTSPSPRD